jgi:type IV pilus assembly protein PilQ
VLLITVDSGSAEGTTTAAAAAPAAQPVPAAAAASGAETTHFAPSLNRTAQTLQAIDFRRGADGAGRVIVDLPSNQVGVDIRQQGSSLVVEFLRTTVPDSLRKRLDVTDFGTPIQAVTTTQSGDRVRMLVEPRATGSTVPTRATTNSYSRFVRRRSIRTSWCRGRAMRVKSSR